MKEIVLFAVMILTSSLANAQQRTIDRTILFIIDGMHWQVPDKLNMPVFHDLIKEGTYIQKSYVIIPHHPTTGDYSKYNTCSFPNPVMQEGTLFLSPENKMIQEYFWPERKTAFIVNMPTAYRSLGRGFSTLIMDGGLSDSQAVEKSIEILKQDDPYFMRIHLQTAGNEGYNIALAEPDKSYYKNIYGEGSLYVSAIEGADRALGHLVTYLRESGKWENTLLIVTSDHGQSPVGWHPLFEEESWITPTVFVGPGIAKNHTLSYFEHTDITPTIAGLLNVENYKRNGASGRFVTEILESQQSDKYLSKEYVKIFNRQIKEYNLLRAKMIIASEKDASFANMVALLENETFIKPFYTQDRVLEWYLAGDMDGLLSTNEEVLKKMRMMANNLIP